MEDKKKPINIEIDDMSPELIDSLGQWARMEGYSHHPEDLAKLFMEPQQPN